jgi:hypothetical protein
MRRALASRRRSPVVLQFKDFLSFYRTARYAPPTRSIRVPIFFQALGVEREIGAISFLQAFENTKVRAMPCPTQPEFAFRQPRRVERRERML